MNKLNVKYNKEQIRLGIATKQIYLYEIKKLAGILKKQKPDRSLSLDELKIIHSEYEKELEKLNRKKALSLSEEERAAVVTLGGLSLLKKVDKKTAKKIAAEIKQNKESKQDGFKLIKK